MEQENMNDTDNVEDLILMMLKGGILEVTFTKANGDTRVMKATLMKEHLPEQTEPSGPTTRSSSAIRCFDIDKQEWRSFRPSTVTNFRVLEN